jgi:hypothetical protein
MTEPLSGEKVHMLYICMTQWDTGFHTHKKFREIIPQSNDQQQTVGVVDLKTN